MMTLNKNNARKVKQSKNLRDVINDPLTVDDVTGRCDGEGERGEPLA
jgi:hypothetical protein